MLSFTVFATYAQWPWAIGRFMLRRELLQRSWIRLKGFTMCRVGVFLVSIRRRKRWESYSKNNILNDIDIANIYYYDKSIWLSCIPTQQIFCDNGKVFNIPDIKDTILTTAKVSTM